MDESKKEILEKEKIYHEKKKARTPIYIVIGVLIIYAFFFTSKLTIPQPITSEKDVTALGVEEVLHWYLPNIQKIKKSWRSY